MRILFLLVFVFTIPFSQGGGKAIHSNINFFEIDVLGNLYLVNDNELQKFDKNNKLQYTFSNLMFGKIDIVDVQKSTNIFLYYQNFNKIVFLDNKLSIKNSAIDLSELGFAEANLACQSYNNSFWIFNPVNKELLRFNQALEIAERTGNLTNLTNFDLKPIQIIERNNLLYLRDKTNGIFVFDRYGGFLRRMPFLNLDDFFVQTSLWQMLRNDTSFIFNSTTLNIDTVALPINNIQQMRMSSSRVFLKNKNGELFSLDILKL